MLDTTTAAGAAAQYPEIANGEAEVKFTPEQIKAQHKIHKGQYVDMLRENLPTLRSELRAAEYLLAEMTNDRRVNQLKKTFLKGASKVTGGIPPMTEVALRLIASKPKA